MYIKRAITEDIISYLDSFPALLISGARQVGKSTLALNLGIDSYITLDDINIYQMAKNSPKELIKNLPKPVIIDEIQRVPELLVVIKEFIDKDRINGQFILTGSADLKGFKELSDSLAGRLGIIELYGLSQKEIAKKDENIIDMLRADLDNTLLKKFSHDALKAVIDGGYPEMQKLKDKKGKRALV